MYVRMCVSVCGGGGGSVYEHVCVWGGGVYVRMWVGGLYV